MKIFHAYFVHLANIFSLFPLLDDTVERPSASTIEPSAIDIIIKVGIPLTYIYKFIYLNIHIYI
jgi:hypothetical protein